MEPHGKATEDKSSGRSKLVPIVVGGVVATLLLGLVGLSLLRGYNNYNSPASSVTDSQRGLRHIAEGFLLPNSTEVDERKLAAAVKIGDPAAQYLMGLKLIYGDFGFLAPQPPGFHNWHSAGIAGAQPSLRDALPRFTARSPAQTDGFGLVLTAARNGHPAAMFAAYECYQAGIIVPADRAAAANFLEQARLQDNPAALIEVAGHHSYDKQIKSNALERAAALGVPGALHASAAVVENDFRAASIASLVPQHGKDLTLHSSVRVDKDGNWARGAESKTVRVFNDEAPEAKAALQRLHQNGLHNGQLARAIELYSSAAELGYVPSMFQLYGLFHTSVHPLDQARAKTWLESAATSGFFFAILDITSAYYFGDFVPKDDIAALTWFYVARSHPEFPRTDGEGRLRTDDGFIKSLFERMQSLEEQLSEPSRLAAQTRAKELHGLITSNASVWYGNSIPNISPITAALADQRFSPPSLIDWDSFDEPSARSNSDAETPFVP